MMRSALFLIMLLAAMLAFACGDDFTETANGDGDTATDGDADDAGIMYHPHAEIVVDFEGEMADPHVIKVDDTWYIYCTTNDIKGLRVFTSTDLATFTFAGIIWEPTEGTWNWSEANEYWAPHVEVADDGYYLYYTADKRIGVAFSDSPLGPFEEVYDHPFVGNGYGGIGDGEFGETVQDFEELAIDAFVLKDSDGGLTLYFSAYSPMSHIHAIPMVDYVTLANEEPERVHTPDVGSWEGAINEGVWVIEHEGLFHLMYSGNFANTNAYAVGVSTGETPFGPFTRYPNNPILAADNDRGIYGPGHHSVVEGAHDDMLIFYHTKTEAENGWNRRLRYAPISFNSDGFLEVVPFP